MAIQSNLVIALTRGSTEIRSVRSLSSEQGHDVDVLIPAESSEMTVNWSLDISQAELIFMLCERDLTLKTNSSALPDDTITLKAGIPYLWIKDAGIAQPLTEDVAILFATLAAGDDANLKIRALADATP